MPHIETSKKTGKSFLIFDLDELSQGEKALYDAQAAAHAKANKETEKFIELFRKRAEMVKHGAGMDVSCRFGRVNVSQPDPSSRKRGAAKAQASLADFAGVAA
jgi:hypothetical protein